jgi:cell fate (sporulation/competence/biofilm development) regulator YlbF (YheA/YmcA/DUF963 family)
MYFIRMLHQTPSLGALFTGFQELQQDYVERARAGEISLDSPTLQMVITGCFD